MSKEILGDACAFIAGKDGKKNRYLRIGTAMKDTVNGSLSVKLDTLPLPDTGWEGWINIFPRDDKATARPSVRRPLEDMEDDIPF